MIQVIGSVEAMQVAVSATIVQVTVSVENMQAAASVAVKQVTVSNYIVLFLAGTLPETHFLIKLTFKKTFNQLLVQCCYYVETTLAVA